MRIISPYSVRMREIKDQKNSEYEQFPRSDMVIRFVFFRNGDRLAFRLWTKTNLMGQYIERKREL